MVSGEGLLATSLWKRGENCQRYESEGQQEVSLEVSASPPAPTSPGIAFQQCSTWGFLVEATLDDDNGGDYEEGNEDDA